MTWFIAVNLFAATSCVTSTTKAGEEEGLIDPGTAASSTGTLPAKSIAEKTERPTLQQVVTTTSTSTNEKNDGSLGEQSENNSRTPDSTYTIAPSPTANHQLAATATAIADADPIDRSCPEPPPRKPDYNYYYLSPEKWPEPSGSLLSHFWLTRPFPGAGRFLYTDWYPYGYDGGGGYLLHNGIDSAEDAGTPVIAVSDGTVVVAGSDQNKLYGWRCDWYGNLVVLELADRWKNQPVYILYGHVLEISVEVGQTIKRGDQVAEVGIGGAATAPHLHLEVRVGDNDFNSTRNPLLWLAPPESRGLIVGRLVDPQGRPWQGVSVIAFSDQEDEEIYGTWTYLADRNSMINPDEVFAENFVIADLLPGEYDLYTEIQGEAYRFPVTVRGGEISRVEIKTLPFKWSESDGEGS